MSSTATTSPATKTVRAAGSSFDPVFRILCASAATMLLATLGGIVFSLLLGGWPALSKFGLSFFTSSTWDPNADIYGGAGPIVGTLVTAVLSLLIALPLAFGIAVFLVEFCPVWLRRPIGVAVELLAGVPSIVYGMWGLFVFAPLFSQWVELPLITWAPAGSIWEKAFSGIPNGSGILAASIILAVMILPYIAATMRELFLTVPPKVRESAYGVGCTTVEVVSSPSSSATATPSPRGSSTADRP